MYCRNCGKIYEPETADALSGARLSLRTIVMAAYLKHAMRMSLEGVSEAMKELFSIKVSEGEVQDILYQLSDSLGQEAHGHHILEEERGEYGTLDIRYQSGGHIPRLQEQQP